MATTSTISSRAGSWFASSLSALLTAGFVLFVLTIAINTVLEKKGARTALITTRGFRDTYAIGRGNGIPSSLRLENFTAIVAFGKLPSSCPATRSGSATLSNAERWGTSRKS